MATESTNTPEGETPPEGTGTSTSTEETSGQEGQEPTVKIDDSTQLPETHPLIVNHAKLKEDLAKAKTDLAEARAQAKRTTELEEDLGKRPTTEALETLQKRSDRLETFLAQIPGPLGKALDSRSFTKELFETDKDIATIVKDYLKANPTATSTALGSGSANPQDGKVDANTLIRIAAGKA